MSDWYYVHGSQQYGPLNDKEFRQAARDQRIRPDDFVWREGMSDWEPASSIKGLYAAQPPKADNEKFCHECGAVIRMKAEMCPQCGVRQPSVFGQGAAVDASNGRGILTIPVLVSAIGNVALGCFWICTICGIPIGIAMIVLCIFEFMFYSESDRISPEQLVQKSNTLAICEIVLGLLNLISFVCGIILLVNKGKYQRLIAGGP